MKYRKRPIVVDAIQLKYGNYEAISEFAEAGLLSNGKPELTAGAEPMTRVLSIPTLEGLMVAQDGDWIIKGVKGELYPCKPDIFEQTYEPVGNNEPLQPTLDEIGHDDWGDRR